MNKYEIYTNRLREDLRKISTVEKAVSSRRYFPNGINCIGATASDIRAIIADFQPNNSELTAREVLSVAEHLLQSSQYHEENLIAFGILNEFVKKNYEDDLLLRFEYWLENHVNNWSQVDD